MGLSEPHKADLGEGLVAWLLAGLTGLTGLAGLQLNAIKCVAQIYRIPEDSFQKHTGILGGASE
jgi:hypothetical protein